MGFWTYYSPLGLGILLTLVLQGDVWQWYLDWMPTLEDSLRWPIVLATAAGVGLGCQLALIGTQGAFAQVLPVPGGRSVRGRAAVVSGALILVGLALGIIAALLQAEEVGVAPIAVGGASLAAGLGAVITYVWSWPTAERDFVRERGLAE